MDLLHGYGLKLGQAEQRHKQSKRQSNGRADPDAVFIGRGPVQQVAQAPRRNREPHAGSAPEFTIAPEIFARADCVVTNAMAAKLAVIINIHHFDALTSDPAGQTEKFLAIWRQVAAHYAKFTKTLTFELLNEPKDAATTAVMNPIYDKAIGEIRKTNPHRIVFVGPGRWNSIDELKNLVLPDDDNLIVTVHCYDPFYFTHQGATWAGADTKVTGIQFPGPPAKPLVPDASLQLNRWVLDWIQRYNRSEER